MTDTELAIVGLAAWALAVTLLLVGERTLRVFFQGAAANGFDPYGVGEHGFRQRLVRVHANSYENLALLLAMPLFAVATEQQEVTEGLALVLLAARAAQGITHLVSASVFAVYVRVGFYSVQLAITGFWLWTFWSNA